MHSELKSQIRHLIHRYWRIPLSRLLGDKRVTERLYKRILHKEINWAAPCDLNEKIHWLKLNTDTSEWSRLADKYLVREYVKEKGLEDILIPLYGKWDSADDIDFDNLPLSFILKTNHGSGEIIKVLNKNSINKSLVRRQMNRHLKEVYGYYEGEPHYRKIKSCIIAEEFLKMPETSISTSLIDYKIWCFNGSPAYVWACYNRTKAGCDVEVYDLDWNYHPEKSIFTSHYRNGGGVLQKPKSLSRMLDIAQILSEGFPEVRVDLYEYNDKVYFGEMTFTSAGGYNYFYTQDFLNELGALIVLPK